ncbi:hypothetical protein [Streptomyces sp. NPDC002187]|uniref:hypothetical protein n=1 Tax=Streptomyces sp. NPDC002187 TaxID=3364637 RepID=UPI00368E799F
MSRIVKFFAAPDDESAATALKGGPDGVLESVVFGNFDAEMSAIEWENILTGRGVEELMEAGEPREVAGGDDGFLVFAISHPLTVVLSGAVDDHMAEAAARWVRARAEEREPIEIDVAEAILTDMAALARGAVEAGLTLYCWMA